MLMRAYGNRSRMATHSAVGFGLRVWCVTHAMSAAREMQNTRGLQGQREKGERTRAANNTHVDHTLPHKRQESMDSRAGGSLLPSRNEKAGEGVQ